jgi:heme exporter protein A
VAARRSAPGLAGRVAFDGVSKRFGRFTAVRDLDLEIEPGEFVGLFGPNGAGKTTILRMLAGLSTPTRGRIVVDGEEVAPDRPALRRKLGVVTHDTMHYDGLTARENLRLHASLHGIDAADARVAEVLDLVGLEARAGDRPGTFSHGLAKRLAIARALLHDPPVVVLDEPYAGLDRRAVDALEGVLDGFSEKTVLLTTHSLERGFEHAERAVVLSRGRVRADVPTDRFDGGRAFAEAYERAVRVDGE